ncbi:36877_t:CDS:1, partial [Gigaspora margarita]
KKFQRSPNSFIIYRTVIHNYLKANNFSLAYFTVSKLARKLWKNESESIKNAYKQLSEIKKKPSRSRAVIATKTLKKSLLLLGPQKILLQITPNPTVLLNTRFSIEN